MKWQRNTGFGQIEDRRGQAGAGGGLPDVLGTGDGAGFPIPIPGGAAGGGISGIAFLIIVGILLFRGVLGGTGGLSGLSPGGGVTAGGTLVPQSDTDQQGAYIVDNVQTCWS